MVWDIVQLFLTFAAMTCGIICAHLWSKERDRRMEAEAKAALMEYAAITLKERLEIYKEKREQFGD